MTDTSHKNKEELAESNTEDVGAKAEDQSDSTDAAASNTDTSKESAQTAPADTTRTQSEKTGSMNVVVLSVLVAGAIIVGALFASGVITLPGEEVEETGPLSGMRASDSVATVNGEAVTVAMFNQQYKQTEAFITSMGGGSQFEDDAFKQELQESLVNDLVNAELLYQAANAAGVTVTSEEVDDEFESTKEQVGGQEVLTEQLEAVGLDEASLRDLIRRQMLIERHLDAELNYQNIEVADADVQAFYDEFVVAGEPEGVELPPLADIRDQIESQIAQERSSALIEGYIEQLRADADIEILI